MYSYTVCVLDSTSNIKTLSIPCAELATAKLVQKNLESLFPSAKVFFEKLKHEDEETKQTPNRDLVLLSNTRSIHPPENDFSILEKDLFDEAA